MAQGETPDIGKMIGLIMENPKLMEELSALSKQAETASVSESTPPAVELPETVSSGVPDREAETAPVSAPTAAPAGKASASHGKRQVLLRALRPYLSEKRARALDSMEAIAGLLDMMQG